MSSILSQHLFWWVSKFWTDLKNTCFADNSFVKRSWKRFKDILGCIVFLFLKMRFSLFMKLKVLWATQLSVSLPIPSYGLVKHLCLSRFYPLGGKKRSLSPRGPIDLLIFYLYFYLHPEVNEFYLRRTPTKKFFKSPQTYIY